MRDQGINEIGEEDGEKKCHQGLARDVKETQSQRKQQQGENDASSS
jgi:hypothetical protein